MMSALLTSKQQFKFRFTKLLQLRSRYFHPFFAILKGPEKCFNVKISKLPEKPIF